MTTEQIHIESKLRKTYLYKPFAYWLVITIILCGAFGAEPIDPKAPPSNSLFIFVISLTTFIFFTAALVSFLLRKRVNIQNDTLIILSARGKVVKEKKLNEIVNFQYSNRPLKSNKYPNVIVGSLTFFKVKFTDQTDLMVKKEEFLNFEELRNYLYQYCLRNKIIKRR